MESFDFGKFVCVMMCVLIFVIDVFEIDVVLII